MYQSTSNKQGESSSSSSQPPQQQQNANEQDQEQHVRLSLFFSFSIFISLLISINILFLPNHRVTHVVFLLLSLETQTLVPVAPATTTRYLLSFLHDCVPNTEPYTILHFHVNLYKHNISNQNVQCKRKETIL